MTLIAYEMGRDLVSLAFIYILFYGIGYLASFSLVLKGTKAITFAVPVLGFGWISIFSTWLYRAGLPASLSLIVLSLIVLFTFIVRYNEIKSSLVQVRTAIARPLLTLGLIAIIANLPNLIGGVSFRIFQGNVVDQLNYDSLSVAISQYDYDYLNGVRLKPESFNDFLRYASIFLQSRPSVNVLDVTIAPLLLQPMLNSPYLFTLVLQLMVFQAIFCVSKICFKFSDRKSLLLAAACSLGFSVQYIMDINAWSQLGSLSLILVSLACTLEIFQNLDFEQRARGHLLRSVSVGALVTPIAYIYPEMFIPLLIGLFIGAICPLIGDADFDSARRRLLCLGGGTLIAIALCLPFWSGTMVFMFKQIYFAAADKNEWFKTYQKYVFYSSISESQYVGLYAILSWPVDFLLGVFGLYFLRPPADLSISLRILWKIILYIPLLTILSSLAYTITKNICGKKDVILRMTHGASLAFLAMGVFICLRQQYWTAGKLLGEFGPLMFLLLCQKPSSSFLARQAAKVTIIGLIAANLSFGLARIFSAADGTGLAHSSPAYPSSQYEFLKRSVDWNIFKIIDDADCHHISLAINQPILDHYAQLQLAMGRIPWASSRPINDYYGLVADRGYQTQTASDCRLETSVASSGRVELELRRLQGFSQGPSTAGYRQRLEIGLQQSSNIDATGLHNLELYRGELLRWTNGDAEISLPKWGKGEAGSISLKLWGIAPTGHTPFSLMVNGSIVYEGEVSGKDVEANIPLPIIPDGETLQISLHSTTVTPSGDPRTLGVALRSIILLASRADSVDPAADLDQSH